MAKEASNIHQGIFIKVNFNFVRNMAMGNTLMHVGLSIKANGIMIKRKEGEK